MPVLEVMRVELERHGLPQHYIHRACGELAAHLEESAADLVQQGVQPALALSIASERLGCPVELARTLYREQAANSLWLRHPLLDTLTLAVVVFLILGATQLAAFAAFWRSFSPNALNEAQLISKFLLPMLAGAILRPIFVRHTGKKLWLNCAMLILIGLSATSVIRFVPLADDHAIAILRLTP